MLQPLARAVLKDEPGSREALAQAAAKRIEVDPENWTGG
jgi:hypothetical protein